jgi:predicted acylesterase/phospholipase RssA
MACFTSVVMQGGGIRCFWQAGFLGEAGAKLKLQDKPIFAVSAAAGIAAAWAAGRLEYAIDRFREAASANPRNFYPGNAFSRQPLFPHARIYARVLEQVFSAEAAARLKHGAGLHVLLAKAHPALPTPVIVALGAALYYARRWLAPERRAALARRLGFGADYVDIRTCDGPAGIAALILASSCTPPFTPVLRWQGRPVIDGGLLESVPVGGLTGAHSHPLVLMTRAPGAHERFDFPHQLAFPSRHLAVSAWDYTSPQGIDEALALGRSDAAAFLDRPAPVVAA